MSLNMYVDNKNELPLYINDDWLNTDITFASINCITFQATDYHLNVHWHYYFKSMKFIKQKFMQRNTAKHFTWLLLTSVSLVTFQAYLVAPLINLLASSLHTSTFIMGFAIPCFAIPFGVSCFISSLFVNRVDKIKLIAVVLTLIVFGLLIISSSDNAFIFLIARIITGIFCGCLVQLSLLSVHDIANRNQREKMFNQFIIAHATGMTFGPTFGICLYAVIGWRWEFIALACCAFLLMMYSLQPAFKFSYQNKAASSKYVLKRIRLMMLSNEGKRNYSFVFLTGIFHSGLFVWLSTFISVYCKLANETTGIALLIFGFPGLLMAANVAIAIQTYGRIKIVLTGLLLVAISVSVLLLQTSFYTAMFAIAILSVGYVMTQPFYIGLIKTVRNKNAKSLAIALGFGLLFTGYGTGPIIFNFLNAISFSFSTIALAALSLMLALLSYQTSPRKTAAPAEQKLIDKVVNF